MAIKAPPRIGSYDTEDVTFLLKDLSDAPLERGLETREVEMQGDGHYSETLPHEYRPSARYRATFDRLLAVHATETALLAAVLGDILLARKGKRLVLVSLARAGTPVGVLVRRAIAHRHGISVPHFSVSIIRDRGIDRQALRYMLEHHGPDELQFLDGWTGKGTIARELRSALIEFERSDQVRLDHELAVLADPGRITTCFATRNDALVPSACLNATIAGLISRTVLNDRFIGPHDFHGAKWYRELAGEDVSRRFIETVAEQFPVIDSLVGEWIERARCQPAPDDRGWTIATEIKSELSLPSIHLIKPGIGETTRVLLRRRPWLVFVDPEAEERLAHVRLLARERDVTVLPRSDMPFACCGVIHPSVGSRR